VRGELGLLVERDLHFDADKPISAYADEAREHGRIVTQRGLGRLTNEAPVFQPPGHESWNNLAGSRYSRDYKRVIWQ
jgi:hypothetical protein